MRNEKMRQLSISVTPHQYDLLMVWADRSGMSVAQVLRALVAREATRLSGAPSPPTDARFHGV